MQLEYHMFYFILNKIKKSILDLQHKRKIRNILNFFGGRKNDLIKSIEDNTIKAKVL